MTGANTGACQKIGFRIDHLGVDAHTDRRGADEKLVSGQALYFTHSQVATANSSGQINADCIRPFDTEVSDAVSGNFQHFYFQHYLGVWYIVRRYQFFCDCNRFGRIAYNDGVIFLVNDQIFNFQNGF